MCRPTEVAFYFIVLRQNFTMFYRLVSNPWAKAIFLLQIQDSWNYLIFLKLNLNFI